MTLQPIDSPRRFGKRGLIALAIVGILIVLILVALSIDAGE
ncbi:MAG: cytochrome c biogenesis protein CcdA, partial [Chloroflexi bacterium]